MQEQDKKQEDGIAEIQGKRPGQGFHRPVDLLNRKTSTELLRDLMEVQIIRHIQQQGECRSSITQYRQDL
jgi:hypothetical protein